MKKRALILSIVILSVVTMLLGACTRPARTTSQEPVAVESVIGPLFPNPGGPEVEITLKNLSSEPIVSLKASLEINRAPPSSGPFTFNFDVTSSSPLLPAASISSKLILINGGFSDNVSYPLLIEGKLQSGSSFSYTKQVQITKP
jgi:hypothetical protein